MAGNVELYQERESGKKETALLMDLAGLFSRGNLTGEQGLVVLEATEALLRESKRDQKDEGMFGALAMLYERSDLPVPLVERTLVHLFDQSFWRENLANQLHRTVEFVVKENLDLTKPWRATLRDLFEAKAAAKRQGGKVMTEIRQRFTEHESEDAGDE